MKLDRIFYLFILLFSIFILTSCKHVNKPKVEKGLIDLSNWNFESDGVLQLDGMWEFYHNQLLMPTSFNDSLKYTFQKIPSDWGKYKINNTKIEGHGFSTFRTKLIPNTKDSLYIIKLGRIDVSYKLFANNKLIASGGKIAKINEKNIPEWLFQTAEIFLNNDTIDLVLQIANFKHKKGGVAQSLILTTPTKMQIYEKKLFAYDFFLLGLLIIMAIYHLGLFYLRHLDFSTLYFSLLLIFVAMHLTVGGQMVIKFFFPQINWEILMKINFLGNYLRIAFFSLFIWFMFKEEISSLFVKILVTFSSLMSLVIIFTPASFYTHLFIVFIIMLAISFSFLIYGLFLATIRKKEGAIFSFIGTIIIILAAINDVLYTNLIINTTYLIPFALFLFIFLQSFMISVRFSKAFNRAEYLSNELKLVNNSLEKRVKTRTVEIEQQKEELQTQAQNLLEMNEELYIQSENLQEVNKKLGSTNELLNKNKSKLELKNQKIDKQNVDIKSSIKYAQRLQKAVLTPESEFINCFQDYFIFFRPRDIVSGDFYLLEKVDNYLVLVVADCTGHGVPGGFMSMLSITLIQEIIRNVDLEDTGIFLDELRKKIILSLKQDANKKALGDGLDIALLVFDTKENFMYFSGAYNPVLVIKNNTEEKTILEIKGDRMPIGSYIGKPKSFTTHKMEISKDDCIYLSTDGYKDQRGGSQKRKFMNKNFKKMIFDNHKLEMKKQKKIISQSLDNWLNTGTNHFKQMDDILVIGIKI